MLTVMLSEFKMLKPCINLFIFSRVGLFCVRHSRPWLSSNLVLPFFMPNFYVLVRQQQTIFAILSVVLFPYCFFLVKCSLFSLLIFSVYVYFSSPKILMPCLPGWPLVPTCHQESDIQISVQYQSEHIPRPNVSIPPASFI